MNKIEAGLLAELVDPTPSWGMVVAAAQNDAVLYRLIRMDRAGYADREALLIAAVLWLARERAELMRAEVERRMNEPARPR